MLTTPKVFCGLAVVLLPLASVCAAQSKTSEPSEAEKYVIEQVAAGEMADLTAKFREQHRQLRSSFLEELLMNQNNKYRIHRNGIQIKGAVFPDPVNLSNVEIPHAVNLSACHFNGVRFFQTVFQKSLAIRESVFDGMARFSSMTVMGVLSAPKTRFTDKQQGAEFRVIKVGGPAIFDDATFDGPVTFAYASIGGVFQIARSKFTNKEAEAVFNSMKVDRGFFADDTVFEGAIDAVALEAMFLDLERARFNNPEKKVSFQAISLSYNLFMSNSVFQGPVNLSKASVKGNIELNDTKFSVNPDLSNLTYQNVYPTQGFLSMIKNSASDYSAYTELEKSLQRNGYSSEADDVFIEMKRYERRQGLNPVDTVLSYLSEALQGFGRKRHRVVFYDFGIVLLGAIVFRRRKMVLKSSDPENKSKPESEAGKKFPPYNPLLYSVTLFAPTIDNKYTNNWEPGPTQKNARLYMSVQKYLGYLLVPLTIAIWTGVFK